MRRSGFSIVEVILAGSVLVLIATALSGALIYSREGVGGGGDRERGVFLAGEGIEALRNIRNQDFANLIDGPHGLAIGSNQWFLSGTSDVSGIFTRRIEIATVDANTKHATSTVSWLRGAGKVGIASIGARLTNWRAPVPGQADSLVVDVSNAAIGGNRNSNLLGVTIANSSASPITIDKIAVSWTGTRRIQGISIGGVLVWSSTGPGTPTGKQPSGTTLDIQDFALAANSGVIPIDYFNFDGTMSGNFTIVFTMIDGTQKSAVTKIGVAVAAGGL